MTPPPIILIAGWAYTSQAMLPLKEALDGYDVQVASTSELCQKQPSCAPACRPGLSKYAAELCVRLAVYGGQVDVVGWSMGGIVALEAARKYPGLVSRLVIIGGTARFCAGNDEPPGAPVAVVRAMSLGLRRKPETVLAAFYDRAQAPRASHANENAARSTGVSSLNRDELIQGLDYLQQTDLRNDLDKLALPTLIVHGHEDLIVPWQAGEWLSRQLPRSKWRRLDGLGHALPIEAAPLLAADIRAFLGGNCA